MTTNHPLRIIGFDEMQPIFGRPLRVVGGRVQDIWWRPGSATRITTLAFYYHSKLFVHQLNPPIIAKRNQKVHFALGEMSLINKLGIKEDV